MTKNEIFFFESTFLGPYFSLKMTNVDRKKWKKKSTGKSPHVSWSTVHGPRPHFIDTPVFHSTSTICFHIVPDILSYKKRILCIQFFCRVILYINIYFWMKVLFVFQRKRFLASIASMARRYIVREPMPKSVLFLPEKVTTLFRILVAIGITETHVWLGA